MCLELAVLAGRVFPGIERIDHRERMHVCYLYGAFTQGVVMSEVDHTTETAAVKNWTLWAAGLGIFAIVFGPAAVAWGISLIGH